MKRPFYCAMLLFSLVVFPNNTNAQDAVGVFRSVSPTVVRLFNATSTGTGVVLTREGMILTNAHVVSSPLPFQCTIEVMKDGKRQTVTFKKVKVTKIHKAMDLALVEIDPAEHNAKLAACKLNKQKSPVGQRLYAIGNPATEDNMVLNKTITEGLLSGVDRVIDDVKYYQISAAINPGNSGGPICDANGVVVGIVTLKQADVEGVGFAIPVYDIQLKDFEEYRRKTISAARALALISRAKPLLEQVRLQSNAENNNKSGKPPSAALMLKRAILFQICQEAAHYDPNNSEVFTMLGLVCFLEKEYDAAKAYMLESIRIDPYKQTRPYELLTKSLSQQNLGGGALPVDFELLAKFPTISENWQFIATKLVAKGYQKEGLYLMLHSVTAAKLQRDVATMRESFKRFTDYSKGLAPDELRDINALKPTQVQSNLERIAKLHVEQKGAGVQILVPEFAEFMEQEIGAKLSASQKPFRMFSVFPPDQETLSNARMLKFSGKYEKAVQMAEPLLSNSDSSLQRSALLVIGGAYQQWGQKLATKQRMAANDYFYRSVGFYRQLTKNHGPLSKAEKREYASALFNEACSLALDGQKAKALAVLKEAFEEDFPRPEDALDDPDLVSLQSDSAFKKLVNDFRRN